MCPAHSSYVLPGERGIISLIPLTGFPRGKNLPAMQETQETQIRSLGWEDLLEEEMATYSSILTWGIP